MSKPFSPTYVTYDPNDPLGPLWALLSLAPPFYVASLTLHTLATRDLRGAFLLSGMVGTAGLCTVLKRIVRQPRPPRPSSSYLGGDDASFDESDRFGMPSNHAAFVSFCALFTLCFALTQCGGRPRRRSERGSSTARWMKRWIPSIGAIGIALSCSYSRVHLGYHTPVQVMVGCLIGSLVGLWYAFLYDGVYRELIAPWVERSWLGRDWDVRSYHDEFEDDDDVAGYMAKCLDEFRRTKYVQSQTETKKNT